MIKSRKLTIVMLVLFFIIGTSLSPVLACGGGGSSSSSSSKTSSSSSSNLSSGWAAVAAAESAMARGNTVQANSIIANATAAAKNSNSNNSSNNNLSPGWQAVADAEAAIARGDTAKANQIIASATNVARTETAQREWDQAVKNVNAQWTEQRVAEERARIESSNPNLASWQVTQQINNMRTNELAAATSSINSAYIPTAPAGASPAWYMASARTAEIVTYQNVAYIDGRSTGSLDAQGNHIQSSYLLSPMVYGVNGWMRTTNFTEAKHEYQMADIGAGQNNQILIGNDLTSGKTYSLGQRTGVTIYAGGDPGFWAHERGDGHHTYTPGVNNAPNAPTVGSPSGGSSGGSPSGGGTGPPSYNAPGSSTGVEIMNVDTTSCLVAWGGSSDWFEVRINGNQIHRVNTTSYTATGLTPNTKYSFEVRGGNAHGVTEWVTAMHVPQYAGAYNMTSKGYGGQQLPLSSFAGRSPYMSEKNYVYTLANQPSITNIPSSVSNGNINIAWSANNPAGTTYNLQEDNFDITSFWNIYQGTNTSYNRSIPIDVDWAKVSVLSYPAVADYKNYIWSTSNSSTVLPVRAGDSAFIAIYTEPKVNKVTGFFNTSKGHNNVLNFVPDKDSKHFNAIWGKFYNIPTGLRTGDTITAEFEISNQGSKIVYRIRAINLDGIPTDWSDVYPEVTLNQTSNALKINMVVDGHVSGSMNKRLDR